ncbi:SIMPL domain-containing protein [Alteribacter aurantiacus]|uniref:SIMPL domain-containing protein n=1 Tax=Alteribacter aurantiacus TaxID=254410 RepID=UPI000414438D|nr:SIMPL domain-containing protein [Alteribacter aurantiacus]
MYPYRQHLDQIRSRRATNTLRVKGEGSLSTAPDRANITVGAVTEATEVSEAQQENAQIISDVTAAISSLGVSEDNIQTVEYRIDTQYDFIDGKQVFRGYRVNHLLQITLDDVSLTGSVIDEAVEAGANAISSIQFSLSNPDVLYNQALELALQNAQEKGETIARQLGVSLSTPPVSVKEISPSTTPVPFQTALYAKAESTPIQAGTLTVLALVEVEYQY